MLGFSAQKLQYLEIFVNGKDGISLSRYLTRDDWCIMLSQFDTGAKNFNNTKEISRVLQVPTIFK